MSEIRKAYREIFRSCHPDKNSVENFAFANKKSQVLGGIRDILLDEENKAFYDNGGKIDGEGNVCLNIQQRWENDRTFLMSVITSSHGEYWHHFPQAVQSNFKDQNR